MKKILSFVLCTVICMSASAQTTLDGDMNHDGVLDISDVGLLIDKILNPVIDNHKYVEIGGIKWSTMNLGATTVAGDPSTCYGDYYAWGEVKPYATDVPRTAVSVTSITSWSTDTIWGGTTGTKNGYNWKNYSGDAIAPIYAEWPTPPYDEINEVLTSNYDAVTQKWGDNWRTPTKEDYDTLVKACTGSTSSQPLSYLSTDSPTGGIYLISASQTYLSEYTGIAGILFVDMEDTSKRVFFPSAGYCYDSNFYSGGTTGFYWTSSRYSSIDYAHTMHYNSEDGVNSNFYRPRYIGFPIRPISK